jgi:hypothetical protein
MPVRRGADMEQRGGLPGYPFTANRCAMMAVSLSLNGLREVKALLAENRDFLGPLSRQSCRSSWKPR